VKKRTCTLGLNGPIGSSAHLVLFKDSDGGHDLNGKLAIGSLTIAATQAGTGNPGEIFFDFFANDCASNSYGELRSVVMHAGSTEHLDFPTPQLAPAGGPRTPFCVVVDVLNGNYANNIDITLVGSVR